MKLKNIVFAIAALCGFFIAQSAEATCSNYTDYSDGQVLTASSLDSLQTNYTNCVRDIEDGYAFTGNTSVAGTFSATGSSTFDTSTLYVDATNNRIGVGTTSPLHKLHVIGPSGVAIHMSNSDDSDRGGGITTSGSGGAGAVALNTTSAGYALTFGIDSVEKARIATDGTFVIGGVGSSLASSYLLQVYKSSSGASVNSITKNTSNTAGSNANIVTSVAGSSAGDPAILWEIDGVQIWYAGVDNSGLDTFQIGTGSAVGANVAMAINTSGDASFGRDLLVTRNLTSSGKIYAAGHATTASGANAYLDSGTGELLRSTSSQRYKENITDIELDTSKIYDLRPVSYDDKTNHQRYFGLIAEEVEEIYPQLVDHNKDGDPEYVFYERLSVLLLAEMKVLKAKNDALEARLIAGGL